MNKDKKILWIEKKIEEKSVETNRLNGISHLYNLLYAKSINTAMMHIIESQVEAVISEYELEDGYCTDLLRILGKTPLIVLINEGCEAHAVTALKNGATDYIIRDVRNHYLEILPLTLAKSFNLKIQEEELRKYRNELENIVEERTIELIEMYDKLQNSETNFRNIFNSTNDGIVIFDYNIRFIEANNAVTDQFGVDKEFMATHDLLNYVVPHSIPIVLRGMENIKNGLPSDIAEVEFISPVNGSILCFEVSAVPIIFNQKKAVLAIMRDMAERKQHGRKLFETIIQTEEEERTRIARDLHDDIGPLISALKIYVTSFLESKNIERKNSLATKMVAIIKDVIESLKVISNDMSPHVLENFGLLAAVENFIELFSKTLTITVNSDIKGLRFSKTIETLYYRIIKELINNTVKHAGASKISIDINYTGTILECRYKDNGKGFNWKEQLESPGKGMGISNIISRIRSLGGEYNSNTEPGMGFELNFTLTTTLKDDNNKN